MAATLAHTTVIVRVIFLDRDQVACYCSILLLGSGVMTIKACTKHQVSHIRWKCDNGWEEAEVEQLDQLGSKASGEEGCLGKDKKLQICEMFQQLALPYPWRRGEGYPGCLPGVWCGVHAGGYDQ